MTTLRHLIATLCMMMAALTAGAQHFTGMTGLINTPSADMNRAGDVMIGGYFLNKHFTPTTTGKSGFAIIVRTKGCGKGVLSFNYASD